MYMLIFLRVINDAGPKGEGYPMQNVILVQ